jgi:hypothetical protein
VCMEALARWLRRGVISVTMAADLLSKSLHCELKPLPLSLGFQSTVH